MPWESNTNLCQTLGFTHRRKKKTIPHLSKKIHRRNAKDVGTHDKIESETEQRKEVEV